MLCELQSCGGKSSMLCDLFNISELGCILHYACENTTVDLYIYDTQSLLNTIQAGQKWILDFQ